MSMREIKFRGKNVGTGEWEYGSLVIGSDYYCIVDKYGTESLVDPESVGQYTGLKDKNGVEIYEGDYIKDTYGEVKIVMWHTMTSYSPNLDGEAYDKSSDIQVIGNIYSNTELLK